MKPKPIRIVGVAQPIAPGSIVSARQKAAVSFSQMVADLKQVKVVYIGESHARAGHHQAQLDILRALFEAYENLSIGMEMFDRTYQGVLDQWSAGDLDRQSFLEKTHWYANWRYNFGLYQDILDFIQVNHIRLIGLNIPFHIPPKIASGGIETLSDWERRHLPLDIDMSDEDHRNYVHEIFKKHQHMRGRNNFEHFYSAQCTWEDGMAQAVADALGPEPMAVLVGNGHIVFKFGIPERVYKRTRKSYRTVYLARPGEELKLAVGDYIWVVPSTPPA